MQTSGDKRILSVSHSGGQTSVDPPYLVLGHAFPDLFRELVSLYSLLLHCVQTSNVALITVLHKHLGHRSGLIQSPSTEDGGDGSSTDDDSVSSHLLGLTTGLEIGFSVTLDHQHQLGLVQLGGGAALVGRHLPFL